MKWLLSFITALVLIALGGVFSYLDYQQNGNHDLRTFLRPELPPEELREATPANQPYVAPALPETSEPTSPVEDVVTRTPSAPDLTIGETAIKELFTKKNLSAIVVRQRLGVTQKLFDLIQLDTSLGSFQVFDITWNDASLRIFVFTGANATSAFTSLLSSAQSLVSAGTLQTTRLSEPYGDAFAYVNVPSDATTVRALMQANNQVFGFQYSRAVHGVVSTLFHAYK